MHNFKKSFIPQGLDRYPFLVEMIVEPDFTINVIGIDRLPSRLQELIRKPDIVQVRCECGCKKIYPALPLQTFTALLERWKQEGNVIFN